MLFPLRKFVRGKLTRLSGRWGSYPPVLGENLNRALRIINVPF